MAGERERSEIETETERSKKEGVAEGGRYDGREE